jgi:hypothetical protein
MAVPAAGKIGRLRRCRPASLSPRHEVVSNGLCGGFRRGVEPAARPLLEIGLQRRGATRPSVSGTVSIVFAQRKYVVRRNTKAFFFIRLCLYLMSAATTAHCLASQAS